MFLNPEKDVRINLYEWQRWQILTFQVTLTKGGGALLSSSEYTQDTNHLRSYTKWAGWQGCSQAWAQKPGPPLTKAIGYCCCQAPSLPTAERSHEPWFPRCPSQPLTNKHIIIHPLHRGRGKNMPSLDQEYTLEGNLSSLSFPWTACCQQYCKILITIMISYTVSKRGFIHMKSSSRLMPVLLHVLSL